MAEQPGPHTGLFNGSLGQALREAAGVPPAEATPLERIPIPDGMLDTADLVNKLGGPFTVYDPLLEAVVGDSNQVPVSGDNYDWFETNSDQYYQVVKDSSGQRELVRAHVRPRLKISQDSQIDFAVWILGDGQAEIRLGDDDQQSSQWLIQEEERFGDVKIEKHGKKVFINQVQVKGSDQEISLGNKTVHLVKNRNKGWDLVNQEVYEAMGENDTGGKNWKVGVKQFLEQTVKPRGLRDTVSLIARVAADSGIPGLWWVGAAIMGVNLGAIGIKEFRTFKKIGSLKDWWNQTTFGKLTTGETKTGLDKYDKQAALFWGVGAGGAFMLLSELLSRFIPGPGVGRYFINRALLGYAVPGLLALTIAKDFEENSLEQEQAREWLGLTLGAMSTTITAISAGMFFLGGDALVRQLEQKINEMTGLSTRAVETTTTPIPPTEQPTQTVVPPTHTQAPTHTPTVAPTTTPEASATPFANWHPGVEVNGHLLDQAAAAGHQLDSTPLQVDLFGHHYELFRFDLDQKPSDQVPEAWAVKDPATGQWHPLIWEDKDSQFAVDINGDGVPDGWVDQSSLPHELLLGGRGGGGELPKLDFVIRDLDLNNDGKQDILPHINPDTGKEEFFIDRNDNGLVDFGVDERVQINWTTAPDGLTQIVDRITFTDKSYWQLKDKANSGYEGFVLKGNHEVRLSLNEAVGGQTAARQKILVDQYHELYSPQQIGTQAWLHPESVTMPKPPATSPTPPLVPEQVIETPHGTWHQPQVGKPELDWGVKSNGERLILGPNGGVQGVLEQQLHLRNANLSPDDVAVIAHRAALDNKEAFAGPIGNGSRVTNAISNDPQINNPAVIANIDLHTQVVSVEHFLEDHKDWLWNSGLQRQIAHLELSPQQRYHVAQKVVADPRWLGLNHNDDTAVKSFLLEIIKDWEEDND